MQVADMIKAARNQITNLNVDQVAAALDNANIVLLDVREPGEVAGGTIPGAITAPRGMLEFHADATSPYHLPQMNPAHTVIVYCKSGARSALAAATLVSMGYQDVAHLDGGITAWTDAQRPTTPPIEAAQR